MSFYAFIKKMRFRSNFDNFYNWFNYWFWHRFFFFLGCVIIIGIGFSSPVSASNEWIGNILFGCSGNDPLLKFTAKKDFPFDTATFLNSPLYQNETTTFDFNSNNCSWGEGQGITLRLNTGGYWGSVSQINSLCASQCPACCPNCDELNLTSTDYLLITLYRYYNNYYYDTEPYYFQGEIESAIEISYPEEDATITTDILEAIINYSNFDNFYWLEWEIEKWENATFTFWEEGIREAEEGNNTDTINFYPLYEDNYYRFKVALTDGSIADIWTNWRYFITSETFEYYPPGEPEAWLPIDKEDFYTEHRGEATPTIAWTGITDIIDVVLNPVGNWSYFFSGFFSITGLHDTTASINTKINLIRSYFNYFDDFFGGFPIALIFGIFIIVLLGKTIISMVFKVINLIKP